MYSKNVKISKPHAWNEYDQEYKIVKDTSFRDCGVQCDSIYNNSTEFILKNNDKEDEQSQNRETDNRKKISLRIKTNRRKLHPVS